MTARRSRGEGGLHWDEGRQRWIATTSLGFDGRGKRITRKASGRTKTEARNKLREMLRDHEDGLTVKATNDTVADAVRDWLAFGLARRSVTTIANYRTIAETRIIAPLGARRLRDLSADDVDRWLRAAASTASTRTLRLMHSLLNRAIRHAMARDKFKRNVVTLCGVPTGQPGRAVEVADPRSGKRPSSPPPSGPGFARYIVLSLLTGDGCDREGLPAPAPRRAERGCHRDGRHLPAGRRELVTQVVTQLGGRANTRITRWGCDRGWS